jgi:D-alanyl-D-alanine carboxypeptidase
MASLGRVSFDHKVISHRRKVIPIVLAGTLFAGAAISSASANPATAKRAATLQSRLDQLVAAGVPGVIVLVRNGTQTTTLVAGVSDVTTNDPMQTDMRLRVASLAKSYVAAIVLQLVSEGKIALDDSVGRWLPGVVPNGKNITIEQLLGHRSGIFDYGSDPRLFEPYFAGDFGFVWKPLELVALATSHDPLFAPGGGPSYSSTDYVLLGLIIEKVTGDRLGEEMKARIFDPLHLQATTFATSQKIEEPYAHGYLRRGAKHLIDVTRISPSHVWAGGNIVATAQDVATFYDALFSGQLVPADLLQKMKDATFNPSNIGLGIFQNTFSCGLFYGHDGTIAGYFSFAYQSEDGSRTIVMLANSNTFTDRIGSPRAQRLLGKLAETAACS